MKNILSALVFLTIGLSAAFAQSLQFSEDGKFKIAQFTDIHWTPGVEESEVKVPKLVGEIVEAERPDLLVFTGDIITARPAMEGWKSFALMCEKIGVPYIVTMGNHDPEMTTRDSIYTFLMQQPLFIGDKGPADIAGMGNVVLPVLASDGSKRVNALIYGLDSNDYSPSQERYGYYGWIEYDQIAWYRRQSEYYTARNGGKPLPALAFFHIQLPEYHLGRYGTTPNSGIFTSFVEKQDVMGTFVGHIHSLDTVREHKGIALAYGRNSGYEAHGSIERGSRIIELHEGSYTFDTWIRTLKGTEQMYHYPQAYAQLDAAQTTPMPALQVAPSRKGVSYKYYTGPFQSVTEFSTKGKLEEEGVLPGFTIEQARGRDHFGYDMSSYINIPQDDTYIFSLVSDDGAQLFIDDQLVIDCDGSHSTETTAVKVSLAKGFHKLRLLYFEDYMGESLGLWMESKTCRRQAIPRDMLYQTAIPGQQLRFNADGTFRIAQFTDLHFDPNTEDSQRTLQMMEQLIAQENADLVLLTGDVVTSGPSATAWGMIRSTMEKAGKPYAVMFGNHDTEVTSRDSVFLYLEDSPLFVGERGIRLDRKMGNYILPVFASDGSGKEKALVYCFDSGEFGNDQEFYGQYEWYDWEQIEWYRNQSQSYTNKNGGQPLPAVAYFHIPTLEYRALDNVPDIYGSKPHGSGYGSSEMNSGMFLAFLDQKDVMGTFVGHDHSNDFIAQLNGLALAYGRVSGYDASGWLERGGRIVELREGQFAFDTWNVTPKGREFVYYYPAGISSDDEKQLTYMPAKKIRPKKNGVNYTYYEGNFKNISEIKTKGKKIETGVMPYFIVDEAPVEDHYAYEFQSWIQIPETAVYRFFINSDDGAKLYIDGKLIIDNDGSHSASRKGTKVALDKGFHEIKVEYFEDYMGQELKIRILSRNMPEQLIPQEMLFVR